MSENNSKQIGAISWVDLTVENAEAVRDFYREVVGWNSTGLSMGDYEDFVMTSPGDEKGVAGICHARGENKNVPSQWLIYLTVENLDKSVASCTALGGKILSEPRNAGDSGRFCVIQDIAGAVVGLFEYKWTANGERWMVNENFFIPRLKAVKKTMNSSIGAKCL